jgi:hypothetical protein
MAISRMVGRGFKDCGQIFRTVTRPIILSAVEEEAVHERQVEESAAHTIWDRGRTTLQALCAFGAPRSIKIEDGFHGSCGLIA